MQLGWTLGILLALQVAKSDDVVEPGPPTGIILQDAPGLLLTNCYLYTQRVHVRLDPWDVYRKHADTPKELASDGRFLKTQIQNAVEHAHLTTAHILEQLQKFILTEEELSGTKRQKRFLGALLTAASAIGSLFSIGLSAANSVSLSTIKRQVNDLREEMPEIQQKLVIQQQQLQGVGRTLQGTILAVNLHSALLNNTVYALSKLSHVVETENSEVRMVRDLMVDLLREVSSSVNSLSGGKIPPYLVPLSMVENIVQAATTTTVQASQVHLAYSLGSAIPIYVNPESLEIGFILNLPIIGKQNIYRLKSVLNVGFWQNNTHVHIKTPPLLAYHADNPTLYFIPNMDMCTLTKDIHWVCPSNPFIRDTTERLCGLRAGASLERCTASMTTKDDVGETRVERVGARWLVNTPQQEILLSYDRHDTAIRMKVPNETIFITVPLDTTVHIEDIVLHHLNPERYDVEIEMVDAFRGHSLSLDDALRQQLLSEGTKTVQFSLDQSGLQTTVLGPVVRRSSDSWGTVTGVVLGLLLGGWIVTAGVVLVLLKHIQALHSKIDTLTNIPDRFKRQPWGVLPLSPNASEVGIE